MSSRSGDGTYVSQVGGGGHVPTLQAPKRLLVSPVTERDVHRPVSPSVLIVLLYIPTTGIYSTLVPGYSTSRVPVVRYRYSEFMYIYM